MEIQKGRIMNDLIEPNKNQYIIPVYQRNYEWSSEHCKKLFNDIVDAHKLSRSHFCGSIVYSRLKETNSINYYIIIDGQQRITTIYLLLKALHDSATLDSERDKIETTLYNKDKFNQYNWDEKSKLKLKPIKTDNIQLELLMEDKFDELDKSSDIYKNYELFKSLIADAIKTDSLLDIKRIYDGIENLTCARITLEEKDSPQEVFERINSTGLPLSLSDKIRNFVLMTDENQETLYEEYWLPIEDNVRRRKMSNFLLDYLNMQVDGQIRESSAYDDFKDFYKSNEYTNESMLKELKHYSELYRAFQGGKNDYGARINELLGGIRDLKQTTIYGFLFRVFDDYIDGVFGIAELEKILEFFLNYSIRRLACEVGSNSLRGLYKTLYKRIFANEANKEHYYDAIVSFFTQLNSGDKFPTDQEFILALKEKDIYHKPDLDKYLLAAIENNGSKEKLEITTEITIEHIMPQKLSTNWQKMIGDDWQTVHTELLHTLGNLTLTGYNSELSNSPFSEKKKLLVEKGAKVKVLNSDVLNQDEWNATTIKARAKRLSKLVTEIFPYPTAKVEISFKDPRYKEYSCENPEDATNKQVEYFIFQGEKIFVNTFADMLKAVIRKLYEQDPSVIEDMASKDECIADSSKVVFFSYKPGVVKGDYQIEGTDIYEYTGLSAWYIVDMIRIMLDKYGIDLAEFTYSARDTKTQDK